VPPSRQGRRSPVYPAGESSAAAGDRPASVLGRVLVPEGGPRVGAPAPANEVGKARPVAAAHVSPECRRSWRWRSGRPAALGVGSHSVAVAGRQKSAVGSDELPPFGLAPTNRPRWSVTAGTMFARITRVRGSRTTGLEMARSASQAARGTQTWPDVFATSIAPTRLSTSSFSSASISSRWPHPTFLSSSVEVGCRGLGQGNRKSGRRPRPNSARPFRSGPGRDSDTASKPRPALASPTGTW